MIEERLYQKLQNQKCALTIKQLHKKYSKLYFVFLLRFSSFAKTLTVLM